MKLDSWAFNNLEPEELLEYIIRANNLLLDKSGKDAIRSLIASFCRHRSGRHSRMHSLKWATATRSSGRYLHYHHSRIFSKYPMYSVKYYSFDTPPSSPDWVVFEWIDRFGCSRSISRGLNIAVRASGGNSSASTVQQRSSNHEDA